MIRMIPDESTLLSPYQYRRSEDVSLSAMITFNCAKSFSINRKWTIQSCHNSNCSNPIELTNQIITTLTELFLPARTLLYGLYQFMFTVTMIDFPNFQSSSFVYIQIIPSDILVHLMEFGTSIITRGYEQNLLIDPGRYSINPDETRFDANVSNISIHR